MATTTKYLSIINLEGEALYVRDDEAHFTSVSATLSAAAWSDSTQTVAVDGIKADSYGMVGLSQSVTADQLAAAQEAGLYICGQASGTITIGAASVPDVDIPITVMFAG